MADWSEKVVLVTGGSSGLGKFIAHAFAHGGANVVIAGRDQARLQSAAEELHPMPANSPFGADRPQRVVSAPQQIAAIPADVTRDEDVQRLFAETLQRFGRLDVLVNNAGRSDRGTAVETSADDFRELMELNFLAAVRCTQAAAPHLLKTGGHLVNIGSLAAKTAAPYLGAYPASKFPLAAYSQQLRMELGPQGLHVLLVCPGPIALPDAAARYEHLAAEKGLPPSAGRAGGGARLNGIDPASLAVRIIRACQRRQAELIVPRRARLLFAISSLWPGLGDWIIGRMTNHKNAAASHRVGSSGASE